MIRVLAVEDSRTQAMVLCHDLESAGFTVTLAESGPSALSLLEAEEFDVVVSDVVMPGMDGYELCRLVKSDTRTRDVPVVLLTSLSDPLDVVSALESGADNFLRKPYQPEQLTARVRAAAENRALRKGGAPEGLRLSVLDRPIEITADRQQVLDLLVSAFEELVVTTREVRARESDLARAHADLQQQLLTVGLERNRLQAVVDSVPVPLFVIDPAGSVTHASRTSAHVFSSDTEELRGRRLEDVTRVVDGHGVSIPPEALPHRRAFASKRPESIGGAFDAFLARPDGTRIPVVLQASPVLDERARVVGGVVTAHVLGALTQHDAVTGLPNSAAYLDRATSALAASDGDCALVLVELDRFDVVRAAVGDADGALLVEVARRLRRVFESSMESDGPAECLLAYLGGHKFGVILENLPDSFSVLHLAESARREVAATYPNDDLHVTASVGVALAEKAPTAAELFAAANEALRRAREAGGDSVQLLGRAASQEAMTRLQLEVDLRSAVDAGSIEVHFQPEVDLRTGTLIGFEALARWRHQRLGPVDPAVFIALAEESGLVFALGRQVLRDACRQVRQWQQTSGNEELSIAVNVSAMQLRPELVTEVRGVLDDTGLAPSRLVLEVTETAAMGDPESTLPILDELRGHGVRLALDDFGTGYSSMAYLTRTRFDQIKLDRTFVSGLDRGTADTIVASSIIALGRALDVPVLAEGIEEPEQARKLRELGCRQGQGYLFSRPLDTAGVERLLSAAEVPRWSDARRAGGEG